MCPQFEKDFWGSTSQDKMIHDAAIDNADIIRKQLALYEPDIAICCGKGVAWGLVDALYGGEQQWSTTSNNVKYFKDGGLTVIDYYHPNAYVNSEIMYNSLMATVREVLSSV